MHPVLWSFDIWNRHVVILAYSFFMTIAALVVLSLGLLISTRRGLPFRKTALCLLVMAVSLLIGARLLYIVTNIDLYRRSPGRLFGLDLAGFALYGGLGLAVIVGLVSSRLLKLDVWRLADSIAPSLGLGIGIVRMGCYFNGCCFGKTTALPWGVVYPSGSPAYKYQFAHIIKTQGLGALLQGIQILPVHPTQLYEMLAGFVGATIACWLIRRKAVDGSAFMALALWFTALRWFNYYLRVPDPMLSVSSWFFPILYLTIIAICTVILVWRVTRFMSPQRHEAKHETTLEVEFTPYVKNEPIKRTLIK